MVINDRTHGNDLSQIILMWNVKALALIVQMLLATFWIMSARDVIFNMIIQWQDLSVENFINTDFDLAVLPTFLKT